MAQKLLTKDRGWPAPSKFAHVYENLLSNCPYQVSMLKKLFSLTRPNKLECFVTGNHDPLKSNMRRDSRRDSRFAIRDLRRDSRIALAY